MAIMPPPAFCHLQTGGPRKLPGSEARLEALRLGGFRGLVCTHGRGVRSGCTGTPPSRSPPALQWPHQFRLPGGCPPKLQTPVLGDLQPRRGPPGSVHRGLQWRERRPGAHGPPAWGIWTPELLRAGVLAPPRPLVLLSQVNKGKMLPEHTRCKRLTGLFIKMQVNSW